MKVKRSFCAKLLDRCKIDEYGCWLVPELTYVEGKFSLSNRVYHQFLIGPIPVDMLVVRLCNNASCVNPLHMKLMTRADLDTLSSKRFRVDLSNRQFGRLTAITPGAATGPYKETTWLCVCDCGTEKEVRTKSLLQGKTKSCGCYRMEVIKTEHPHKFRKRVVSVHGKECDICGSTNGTQAHHLYSRHAYPLLRNLPCNGRMLCTEHHENFHNTYGWGNNTLEQYIEYKESINDRA